MSEAEQTEKKRTRISAIDAQLREAKQEYKQQKRALKEHFPQNFDPATLGDYAGLAQQYIFFYARNLSDGAKAEGK